MKYIIIPDNPGTEAFQNIYETLDEARKKAEEISARMNTRVVVAQIIGALQQKVEWVQV
jgi:hypothetical protein